MRATKSYFPAVFGLALALLTASCGGAQSVTHAGTVQGDWPFATDVEASAWVNEVDFSSGNKSLNLVVSLHTVPVAQCLDAAELGPTAAPNQDNLDVVVWGGSTVQDNGDTVYSLPTGIGDFTLTTQGALNRPLHSAGDGYLVKWDASGNQVYPGWIQVSSGTVHFDELSIALNGRVTGSFDITLVQGMHLTGTFATSVCGREINSAP